MTKDTEIEPQYLEQMQQLGRAIDEIFNGKGPKRTGFFLMVYPHGDDFDGRANYISNSDRKNIVVLLKEMAARFEGQPEMKGHA